MKKFLICLTFLISSIFLLDNVKAEYLNSYEPIEDFSFPSTINTDTHNIIIFKMGSGNYWMVYWKKTENIYMTILQDNVNFNDNSLSFRLMNSQYFLDGNISNTKVYYLSSSNHNFNFPVSSANVFTPDKLVFSNTIIYPYKKGDPYFFDPDRDLKPKIPTITLEKKQDLFVEDFNHNTIKTGIILNINIDILDDSKYNYYIKINEGLWTKLNINNFKDNNETITIYENVEIIIKIEDKKGNYITSSSFKVNDIQERFINYEILDGTEKGKKIELEFHNYLNTDYAIITNFQTGTEQKIENLKENKEYTIDNINLDSTYTINCYDQDNNKLNSINIDIEKENLELSKERYIEIFNLNTNRNNSYKVRFHNTKKDDKCYIKINSGLETAVNCNETREVYSITNTYAENIIKDKENNIKAKRIVNLNYLKDMPYFEFDSYFDYEESKQVLKIIANNLKNGDSIYYSHDKEIWYSLETKRINELSFYSNTEIYFKIERQNEIISESYFNVIYKSFENSETDKINKKDISKGLLDFFKDISNNFKDNVLKYFTSVYNSLKKSKIALYLTIIIFSSILILFIKSIKR